MEQWLSARPSREEIAGFMGGCGRVPSVSRRKTVFFATLGAVFPKVLKAVLLLALGFVGLRIGQPHAKSYQFARIIRDEVETQAVRPHPSELHRRVLELAANNELVLGDGDVTVAPLDSGGFEVKVHYNVPVDLLFYQYVEHFDFVSRTRSTALPQ